MSQRSQAQKKQSRSWPLDAETAQVPGVVGEMAEYRKWTDPLLRKENDKAAANSRLKLHASLALLPVDPGQVEHLYGRLLQAGPQEVMVIRQALFDHKQEITEPLWTLLEDPKSAQDQRFHAACALAAFSPDDSRWEKVRGDVAATLVMQKPFVIAQWTDALKGVRSRLMPSLADFLGDEKRSVSERSLIASVYETFAADMVDSYEGLEKRLEEPTAPDASTEAKVALAKGKTNIAVMLVVMGRETKVWPLLKHQSDPTLRSFLIKRMVPGGVDAKVLISRLNEEKDVSVKRALLWIMGELRLTQGERQNLLPRLVRLYHDDPDPGIHGAVEWLLRQWQATDQLKAIDKDLATGTVAGERQWFLNRQGQTMMIVSRPDEFWMGDGPERHRRQIGRSFAIGSKEVTVEQFLRFRKDHRFFKGNAPSGDCPAGGRHGATQPPIATG